MSDTVTLGLEHYLRVVRRQWRLVVACVAGGLLVGAATLLLTPERYTATTELNLSVVTTDPFSPQRAASGLLDDATERAIARSHVVAIHAADRLAEPVEAGALAGAVDVTISEGGTIAHVAASGPSPSSAVERADAVAQAYLDYRSAQAQARLDVMVTGLDERIETLHARLADANATLADGPGDSTRAQATSDRDQLLVELEGLLSQRGALQSVDTSGGTVLTAAADGEVGVEPSRRLVLVTGLAAGLVLGLLAAFVRNPADRRLRTAAEITQHGGRVIARLDASPAPSVDGAGDDAIGVARERLLAEISAEARTVLVLDDAATSSGTAVALAASIARIGRRTRLLIAAPAAPVSPLDRGASARPPVAEKLTVRTCRATGDDGVVELSREITRGEAAPDAVTLVALSTHDPEPVLLSAFRQADALVLVAHEGVTTTTTLSWLQAESAEAGIDLLGVIALAPAPRRRRRLGRASETGRRPRTDAEDAEGRAHAG